MGPLAGIKVLDLSRILAGPWATQCLADFGATVWKVEKPGDGDDTRHWGPPWIKDGKGKATADSAYFASTNRGKQSLAIDFTKPAGQRLIRSLALRADVLIENFKVGTLAKYRLGYESLGKLNSKLIYCSISAYGQDGPAAAEPGYDAMIQAVSGLMSVTGVPDGEPGAGPIKVGVAVSDLITGLYAAIAISSALVEREQSGRGQYIDLALLDTQVAALANQSLNYLMTGKPPVRRGTAHPNIVPYQAFPTKDGWLMLAVGNDRQYRGVLQGGRQARARERQEIPDELRPSLESRGADHRNRKAMREKIDRCMAQDSLQQPAFLAGPSTTSRKYLMNRRSSTGNCASICPTRVEDKSHRCVIQSYSRAAMSTVANRLHCSARTPKHVLISELGLTEAEILSLKTDGAIG